MSEKIKEILIEHKTKSNKDLVLAMDFLSKEFDILISLYSGESGALDFLAQSAKAKLTVGYYREKQSDFYDLMVHNSSQNFDKAMKQIDKVLMMINA